MFHLKDYGNEDTIAAISTPWGYGGIGIVRLSGKESFGVAHRIFVPALKGNKYPRSHHLYYGHINDDNGDIIDEVLVSFMKGYASYTKEDIVEINCHSGVVALKMILSSVLKNGARIAEPGEFTKRAFLNGRIDLSQAESVLQLLSARSEKAVKNAAKLLRGDLSGSVNELRNKIILWIAAIEASVDFPGEAGEIDLSTFKQEMAIISDKIINICRTADKGDIFQNGLKVSIVGKPNVGKSSLLNILLNKQRAIVTEIPGTTRDIIEENIYLKGVPVSLIDTAGIRKTHDPVEKEGVFLARQVIKESDLILFMVDGAAGIKEEDLEILQQIREEEKIFFLIINKIDIADIISLKEPEKITDKFNIIKISALKKTGIDVLEEKITAFIESGEFFEEGFMITEMRHKEILADAAMLIKKIINNTDKDPVDLIAQDLKELEEKLGEISGMTITGDILDVVFSRFCLGK